MGMSGLPDMYTRGPRAGVYISGKPQVSMLQLICAMPWIVDKHKSFMPHTTPHSPVFIWIP